MKNNIQSYSSRLGATSKQFLVPSGSQLLLYLLISFLLLIGLNIKNAWDYLNQQVIAPEGGLDSFINQKSPWLSRTINSLSHSIALQVVFWVAVGCIVYVIIWFVRNVAISILNDIAADKYMHPASYKRTTYWESIVARKIFFGVSLIVLVAYLASAAKLMAYLANLSHRLIVNFHPSTSLLELTEAVLATTAMVYLLILVAHVVVSSWKFVYKDL